MSDDFNHAESMKMFREVERLAKQEAELQKQWAEDAKKPVKKQKRLNMIRWFKPRPVE